MKTSKTAAVAFLIAALPLAASAFAHDRGYGYDDDDYDQPRYHRDYHDRGWDRCDHDRRFRRDDYRYRSSYYERRDWDDDRPRVMAPVVAPVMVPRVVTTRVVLPIPPLPPVPMIVLKKHHDARIVLRPMF